MFSLIITVISIALVAALALATLYYGGGAFNKGSADADASKIVLQGQQLLGAAELFYAEQNRWPATRDELVNLNYLKAVPQAQLNGVSSALANNVEWTMVPGQPVFVLDTGLPGETCAAVNVKGSLGQRGILRQAYTSLNAQCYGESTFKVVFKKFTTPDALAGLPVAEVSPDPAPPTYADEPGAWTMQPGGTAPGGGTGGGDNGGGDNGGGGPVGGGDVDTGAPPADLGLNVTVNPGGWTVAKPIDTETRKAFTLTNNGSDPVRVSDYWFDLGYPFYLYESEDANDCFNRWELQAGQSCALTVVFAPYSGAGTTMNDIFHIEVSDVNWNSYVTDLPVQGTVLGTDGEETVPLMYDVTISPDPLSAFKNVPANTAAEQVFVLTNTGTGTAYPYFYLYDEERFMVAEGWRNSSDCDNVWRLAPGQSCTFTLLYNAGDGTATVDTDTLYIEISTDADYGDREYPLEATIVTSGAAPSLSATPSSVSFGTVAIGTYETQLVSIRNTGATPVTVARAINELNMATVGSTTYTDYYNGDCPWYEASQCFFEGEDHDCVAVAPGATCTVQLHYAPLSAGAVSGNLHLYFEGQAAPYSVPLTATGVDNGAPVTAALEGQTARVRYDVETFDGSSGEYEWGTTTAVHQVTSNKNFTATFTLTNTTGVPLNMDPNPFTTTRTATTCGAVLAPGSSCTETHFYENIADEYYNWLYNGGDRAVPATWNLNQDHGGTLWLQPPAIEALVPTPAPNTAVFAGLSSADPAAVPMFTQWDYASCMSSTTNTAPNYTNYNKCYAETIQRGIGGATRCTASVETPHANALIRYGSDHVVQSFIRCTGINNSWSPLDFISAYRLVFANPYKERQVYTTPLVTRTVWFWGTYSTVTVAAGTLPLTSEVVEACTQHTTVLNQNVCVSNLVRNMLGGNATCQVRYDGPTPQMKAANPAAVSQSYLQCTHYSGAAGETEVMNSFTFTGKH